MLVLEELARLFNKLDDAPSLVASGVVLGVVLLTAVGLFFLVSMLIN